MSQKKTTKSTTATESVAEDNTPKQADVAPAINLEDLNNAATIIGLAVKRGAYEPAEVRQVGEVFEKLTTFLQYQVKLAEAANADKENA